LSARAAAGSKLPVAPVGQVNQCLTVAFDAARALESHDGRASARSRVGSWILAEQFTAVALLVEVGPATGTGSLPQVSFLARWLRGLNQ